MNIKYGNIQKDIIEHTAQQNEEKLLFGITM